MREHNVATHEFAALTHRNQADATFARTLMESAAAVFDLQLERAGQKAQSDPCLLRSRVARYVIQSLLQDTVDVYSSRAVDGKRLPLLLIGYGNSRLPFYVGDIPVHRALQSSFIKHDRVQGLGEAAHAFQRRLDGFKHFLQVGAQRGAFGSMGSGAAQHGAYSGQDLSELVVQFSRNVAQSGFLRGDQFLGKFAAAIRNLLHAGKEAAVPADQGQSVEQNCKQRACEKDINLPPHTVVNLNDALPCLLLVLAVLHEEAGDGCAEGRLPLLQGKLDLLAGLLLFAFLRECKDAVDGVPELSERAAQERALLGSAAGGGETSLKPHGVIEIGANALELRRPCRQGIRLVAADHVTHGHGEQIEIVLDPQ